MSADRTVRVTWWPGVGLGVWWYVWGAHGFWWGVLYGFFWPVWAGYRLARYLLGG
jgi:hypothetical protein